ncbi:zinc dependent phospholipase C family protein [Haloimpatiens lingqiaonensis]|uniref:zinc dependent phospholipase C family protein n=1 Tax=Haloimpatiens lingqiaonensis TaxID=1380675 RepID=UPI0010FDEC31|nr:zinc dependent phospholipase C family protein [Haloimpatiens lingqiaonensis]
MSRKKIERTYGSTLKGIMFAVNPIKKKVLKTHCTVHKFINLKAINILKINGYQEEYDFFKQNARTINEGVVWADQDFKSSNHFYHVVKGKGLYGFSDALTECKKYYSNSLKYLKENNIKKSLFYLGAACHLIQDATVPQHVNNKLLKSHRKFEIWIISKLMSDYSFEEEKSLKKFSYIEEYIKNNAVFADNTYREFKNIENLEERYDKISRKIISEAQKTTAGFLLDYYEEYKDTYSK